MSKQTLIFDASVIAENGQKGHGRSGIYFTAVNILNQLLKSDKFDVAIYCDLMHPGFSEFIKNNFGKTSVRIYCGNRYGRILVELSNFDAYLRRHGHNIIKLLINVFVRKPIGMLGRLLTRLPRFDIALSPIYVLPQKIRADKKYIVLYDAIPWLLSGYYKSARSNTHYWFDILARYVKSKPACEYFAISERTKADFIRLLDMTPDDITVMPLAAGDNFYPETDNGKIVAVRKKYNIPVDKKYIFSLCTLEPRKNLVRAVKTFIEFIKKNNIDDLVFALGGAHWDKFIGKLESEIQDLGKYQNKIIRAGYIDDGDLAALYSGAEWFVYTSQYEGFGLPPLEAMKCGCPVITSNNSSLPEVVGDAGIMIDWDSDEQHIAAYEKYYFDYACRNKMAKAGLRRANKFSWKSTVDIMINKMQKE